MKKILTVLVIVTALVSCGKPKEKLYIFNWADYMSQDVVHKFEKKYNCTVVMNYYDSNEALYAKLKAGASGYDLLFPSSYMSKLMYEQDMLTAIDHSKLANLGNIDSEYLKLTVDPEMKYSIPYMVSYSGIAYDKTRIGDFKPTWAMFDRSDLAGRITLFNDMREVIGAALKYHGYSYNTTNEAELAKAQETVIRWKKNIAKFDVDEAKRGLSSGEFVMIQAYSGDALQLMEENENLAFSIPVEGTSIAQDDFVIPRDAQHVDLAYKFIDFMIEAENAKDNMEFVYYWSPNSAALKMMDTEFLENEAVTPAREIQEKSDFLLDLGGNNELYTKTWDIIKSSN